MRVGEIDKGYFGVQCISGLAYPGRRNYLTQTAGVEFDAQMYWKPKSKETVADGLICDDKKLEGR